MSGRIVSARRRRGRALAGALLLLALPGMAEAAPAAVSVADGKTVFQQSCAVCHSTVAEFHKEGPSLAGIYGRRAGTAPFFPQYRGLRDADFVWTERSLDAWLADPRAFLGGRDTTMNFRLADPEARAVVIAYLKTLR